MNYLSNHIISYCQRFVYCQRLRMRRSLVQLSGVVKVVNKTVTGWVSLYNKSCHIYSMRLYRHYVSYEKYWTLYIQFLTDLELKYFSNCILASANFNFLLLNSVFWVHFQWGIFNLSHYSLLTSRFVSLNLLVMLKVLYLAYKNFDILRPESGLLLIFFF